MIVIDVLLYALLLATVWFVLVTTILLLLYGKEFKRFWLEPMLRYPVVIFESDDWGVGPDIQTPILYDLLNLFLQYHDQRHHHPILTLGLILAEPDKEKISKHNNKYYRRNLSDSKYSNLVKIIKKGHERGVFSLHLHGMEHFWPDSLMKSTDLEGVKSWLFDAQTLETEKLPSHLQSRWCDTSTLPSVPINKSEIEKAVKTEIACFVNIFFQEPKVVVPPTFVWTDNVINAYASNNVHIIVSPGQQYIGRDMNGKLVSNNRTFYNGDTDRDHKVLYLVRDVYFEPDVGHKAERVLKDIVNRIQCGRPALLEMHRLNFLANKKDSLSELRRLLDLIRNELPEALFISTEELAQVYFSKDVDFLLVSGLERFQVWLERVRLFLSNKRIAKYSGFNQVFCVFIVLGKSPGKFH